ncbi:hypothetical protein QBC47DRAFT_395489 [Echria macrotheca]|uniref:Extracellular membrane protein CFEM domain-containing protein n=1 Tax=Echria macrotheca TaxID=438768 RepID=A0AAJ0B5D2_9PEZI|nr:hypothetical protein QBC47DRAFT_395489 [Echria macrotheca]
MMSAAPYSHFAGRPLLLLLVAAAIPFGLGGTPTSTPTPIFIDVVPGYSNLPPCAEAALSTIVRDEARGCRDNSEMTSFACFCTRSYSKISWDISTAVVDQCGGTGVSTAAAAAAAVVQATSAVDVFHRYCADGTKQLPPKGTAT